MSSSIQETATKPLKKPMFMHSEVFLLSWLLALLFPKRQNLCDDLSDLRCKGGGGETEREWLPLCCMIYYRSKVRREAWVFCESQMDKRCHFSVRAVCLLNCVTSVRLDTWNCRDRAPNLFGAAVRLPSRHDAPLFFRSL